MMVKKVIDQLKIITPERNHLIQLTKELKSEVKNVVKTACIPTAAPYLLPLFLVNFAQKHRGTKIEVNNLPPMKSFVN